VNSSQPTMSLVNGDIGKGKVGEGGRSFSLSMLNGKKEGKRKKKERTA